MTDGEDLDVAPNIDIVSDMKPKPTIQKAVITNNGITTDHNPFRRKEGQSPVNGSLRADSDPEKPSIQETTK